MPSKQQMKFKQTEIGIIPEEWQILPFDRLIAHVVDNRGRSAPTSKEGIPLIATNCIKESGLFPIKEKIRYVSKETYDNWFRDHPKPNDIIIVNKGTPGLVCLVPDPVDLCFAQDMVSVRPDENMIYGRFLFAFMRSSIFKHQVDSINVGTTIPHLKKTYFPMLMVPIPTKNEQRMIGDIYYNISRKMEINQQMNRTLEEIGKSIFKHWFIDFEFPNEEGKPYKSSGGEMVYDEELEKDLPKGWEVKDISQEFNLVMGQSPPGSSYNEAGEGVIFFQGRADFGGRFPLIRMFCTEPIRFAKKDDTIVSVRAPVGDINLALQDCCIGRGLAAIRHKSNNSSYTYYSMMTLKPTFDHFEAEGTVFGSINKVNFERIRVLAPPRKIIDLFENMIRPFDEKVENNTLEILTLSSIRDSLLPRLMSGKIRVPTETK